MNSFKCSPNKVLNLWKHAGIPCEIFLAWLWLSHVFFKLISRHYIVIWNLFLIFRSFLLKRIVAQMSIDIADVIQIKCTPTKFEISRWKNTNIQGLPRVNKYPLSEIKFCSFLNLTTKKAERSLNIFLNYFLLRLIFVHDDLRKFAGTIDPHSTSIVRWFHDPYVSTTINLSVLRLRFQKLSMKSYNLKLFVSCKLLILWKACAGYSLLILN